MAEQHNTEWKESWKDDYLKTVSAFANTEGGTLVIGKNDNGHIVGVDNSKKLMEDLPNKIRNYLGLISEVKLHQENGKDFIEIKAEPYTVPISYRGKYYIRSGSTTQQLSGSALNDYMLKKLGVDWDEVVEPRATLDDIDRVAIDAFCRSASASDRMPFISEKDSTEKILRNLQLISEDGKLKRAAILLFGKNPRKYFMYAYLKIGKFGESSSELLHQNVIESNAFELADKALEILDRLYIIKTISYQRLQRIETPEYPYPAIRELLLNAVVHRLYETSAITIRLYEDRMVIWNLGELPKQLSPGDLKEEHDSYPRNYLLADVFFKSGYIEAWGRGTVKVFEECRRYGLPEPLIEERGGGVAVTLFKDKYTEGYLSKLDLNDRQKKVIDYIKTNEFITNSIYREMFDVANKTVIRDLDELMELKLVKRKGGGRSTQYILNMNQP